MRGGAARGAAVAIAIEAAAEYGDDKGAEEGGGSEVMDLGEGWRVLDDL